MSCDLIPILKNGKESELFKALLLRLGDRPKATRVYKLVYSTDFLSHFGDWVNAPSTVRSKLDANGEPKVEEIFPYLENSTGGDFQIGEPTKRLSGAVSFYVNEGSTTSQVLQKIKDGARDVRDRTMAEQLMKNAAIVGDVPFEVVDRGDFVMKYTTVGGRPKILINSRNVNMRSGSDIPTILLHEIVHAYTGQVFRANDTVLSDHERAFVRDLRSMYSVAKNSEDDFGRDIFDRAYESVEEFAAEVVSNRAFQEHLSQRNQGNLWRQIVSAFRRLFGLPSSDVATSRVLSYIASARRSEFGVSLELAFPDDSTRQDQAALSAKQKILKKAIESVQRRINEFQHRAIRLESKTAIAQMEVQKQSLELEFNKGHTEKGLIDYATTSYEQVQQLYNNLAVHLKNGTLTIPILNEVHKYAQSFQVTDDVQAEVLADPDLQLKYPEALRMLERTQSLLRGIHRTYMHEIKELMIDKLLPYERKAEAEVRIEAEREFNRDLSGSIPRKERDQRREEFIDKRVEEAQEDIRARSERMLRDQFDVAAQDISQLQYWAVAIQNGSDQLLAITKELIDRAQDEVRDEYNEIEHQLKHHLDRLTEYKNNPSDPLTLYEDILERDKDGKLTKHLVAPYLSSWHDSYHNTVEEASRIDDPVKRRKFIKAWLGQNAKLSKEWKEDRTAMNRQSVQIKREKGPKAAKEFRQAWHRANRSRKWIPANKWKNPQFEKLEKMDDNNPVKAFYNFAVRMQHEFDQGRPEFKQLGFRLPAIRKTKVERLLSQGVPSLGSVWEAATEEYRIQQDDTEFGDLTVSQNIAGDINKFVPLYYTSRNMPVEDQSFDVASLLAANAFMSLNHKHMNGILPELESVKSILGERDVTQRSGLGQRLLKRGSSDPHTIQGRDSAAYKLYNAMLDDKVFGQSYIPKDFAGLNPKIHNAIMGYTSTVMLAGNVAASFMNVTLGTTLFNIEALVGHHFDKSDWIAAAKGYYGGRNILDNLNDIGANQVSSFTNMLSEDYDTMNDFRGKRFDYVDNKWWKKMLSGSTLHGLNNLGEHLNQNLTMYAMLHNVRVKNSNGEYIDKEGNVVTNKKKAMTLLDAYSVQDGKLVVSPLVKKVNINGRTMDWGRDAHFAITQRIRHINELLHGAYSQQNRSEMQRHVWGRYMMMMRKWIEPGVRRRWRGFSLGKILRGEDTERFWSQQLNEFEQGAYVTSLAFVRRLMKDLRFWQYLFRVPGEWAQLTEYEKANVQRTVYEVGISVVGLALAAVAQAAAKSAPDDTPEEKTLWFFAYEANRLWTELTFYWNPTEALRIIEDPTPTVSIIQDIFNLTSQVFFNPTERYVQGRRKGELKIQKRVEQVFPVYRHFDRLLNMNETLSFFNRR